MKDLVNDVHTTDPYKFGLQLNIENYNLEVVMSNNRDRKQEQLREVLNIYLRQTPHPSWKQVALALQNIGEGRNAAKIAGKYGTYCKNMVHNCKNIRCIISAIYCISSKRCHSYYIFISAVLQCDQRGRLIPLPSLMHLLLPSTFTC